jgi:putative inorganic carbon (HCO3(-)) transporter
MESTPARWSQRLVEAAILGFVFFSPWSIAGAQICLAVGLMAWAAKLVVCRGRGFQRTPLDLPIIAFLGIELLSVLLSPNLLKGLWALRQEWIVLLFFLVVNNVRCQDSARRALDLLVIVTAAVSLYAIWQHFLGWDLYRQRPLLATGNVFEATGLFGHHLTYGGYVMVVLLVCGCLFFWGFSGRKRALYGLASLLLTLALIWSYARSAWVGLWGGIVAIGLLRGRKTLILGLAGAAIGFVLLILFEPSVRLQTQQLIEMLQAPPAKPSRIHMWSASLKIIRDHPLLGVGVGRMKMSMVAYGCHLGYAHPHNDLLNVAAQTGLLGLAGFLWIWVTFLRMAARCRLSKRAQGFSSGLAMAGFGLMIAFLVAGLFQCYYTDSEDGMILWFLLGLVTAVCKMEGDGEGAPLDLLRVKSGWTIKGKASSG